MDKLITVRDVKDRYGCSGPTARKYIRQCVPHMENPCTTYEWALKDWERSRIKVEQKKISKAEFERITARIREGRTIVPRTW